MANARSDTPTHESPNLRVVDLPALDGPEGDAIDYLLSCKRSASEGQAGRGSKQGSTSKYKGVWRHRTITKGRWSYDYWEANITYKGEKYTIARHKHAEPEAEKKAALAYDRAAIICWGKHARTNQMMYPEDFKESANEISK